MNVQFDNCEVPIWKLRKGTVVFYVDTYYHIANIYDLQNEDKNIELELENTHEQDFYVGSKNVTWLEPF